MGLRSRPRFVDTVWAVLCAFRPSAQTVSLFVAVVAAGTSGGVLAAAAVYLAYYVVFAAAPTRLVHGSNPTILELLKRAPSLQWRHWPALIFHSDILILLYLAQEDLLNLFYPVCSQERQLVPLPDDAGVTSLDWANAPPSGSRGGVVCVILHGVTGTPKDRCVRLLVNAAVERGWYTAVQYRRGHIDTEPPVDTFSLFGSTLETHAAMTAAAARSPGCRVVILGVSAGSAAAMRYAAEQAHGELPPGWAREHASPLPGLAACVCIAPGFDIASAARRCEKRYDPIMSDRMRQYFVSGRHHVELRKRSPSAVDACLRARTTQEFLEAHAPLSGAKSWSDYCEATNPMRAVRPAPPRGMVPTVFINARDDPICTYGNIQQVEAEGLFSSSEAPLLLVETPRGSHACWHGLLFGSGYLKRTVVDFVEAALSVHTDQTRDARLRHGG